MIDKDFCMSSYLVFRYVIDDEYDFFESTKHQVYKLIPENDRILVYDENDVDSEIKKQISLLKNKKVGILLSGGMDSACLASYIPGSDAYTFRFMEGEFQKEELKRAELFAEKYCLKLHYVDISWDTVKNNLEFLMKVKGAPVHSIEPQVYEAAKQAKNDGIDLMVIGDAADYVFAGMDGLHAKDWEFDEFVERYTYLNPKEILLNPVDMNEAFEKYRVEDKIDYIGLMHEYADIESYASYANAFDAAKMNYIDPYEILKMGNPLDIYRIRNGESKYLIRSLFKLKYPDIPVPNKNPMPRPVDIYFENWEGPKRKEFRDDININKYTGNQKWQMYCLEKFLDMYE